MEGFENPRGLGFVIPSVIPSGQTLEEGPTGQTQSVVPEILVHTDFIRSSFLFPGPVLGAPEKACWEHRHL